MKEIKKVFSSFLHFFQSGKDLEKLKKLWTEEEKGKRDLLLDHMQLLLDRTGKKEFDAFDNDPEKKTSNAVLKFYDLALERIQKDISSTQVKEGTIVFWYLYNMGFVIKSPKSCFGVDIHHRHGKKLADLLDFVLVTHNHQDHYSLPLLQEMTKKGKGVISNFFPNRFYTKEKNTSYDLSGIRIHCLEADHNAELKKFTMPAEIIVPAGDKKFVFFTSGDCASECFLEKKSEKIHLYAIHPLCIMNTEKAVKKLSPDLTFIVHLQELSHEIGVWRWSIDDGRKKMRELQQAHYPCYLPVWGEKFLWDGETISSQKDSF